ncbi:NAD-dependent succinate-semialdehyde dehydrogenase [Sphingomonas sp. C8-2]|nr:NAD-dependent succinate-semialdehyde dehydrogenase [Sphingomonas sp. C8-2]
MHQQVRAPYRSEAQKIRLRPECRIARCKSEDVTEVTKSTYPDTQLLIGGRWRDGGAGMVIPVINPATEERIGEVAHAEESDLADAVREAEAGFRIWRGTPAVERSRVLRRAAELIRERSEDIARLMTLEQGKPLYDSRGEVIGSADIVDWMADEAKRIYGRVVPARTASTYQLVLKEPIGVVAGFTPWNFPVSQVARKVGTALAAGCSIILKAAEETPAAPAAMVQAFLDAGLPNGVLNLVYGRPDQISERLISDPTIRKITFTGSTQVGKHLAGLAGQHMKRATMELGGHAPALLFEDANVETAAAALVGWKFRNAGQICVSPTRFIVHERIHDDFIEAFVSKSRALRIGDGMDETTQMGPLANPRRVTAMEEMVADAVQKGARLETGGKRIANKGYFYEPTVLTGVPREARAMNEEPFGPLALISSFSSFHEAIAEANRLSYGLASYAFTGSTLTATNAASAIEAGMLSINGFGIGLPEVPFGGVKDSGYGSEGGTEAIDAYLATKFVSQTAA